MTVRKGWGRWRNCYRKAMCLTLLVASMRGPKLLTMTSQFIDLRGCTWHMWITWHDWCFLGFLFPFGIFTEWTEGKRMRWPSGMKSQQILIQRKKQPTSALARHLKPTATCMRWRITTTLGWGWKCLWLQVTTLATIDPSSSPSSLPTTLGNASHTAVTIAIDSVLAIFSPDCQSVTPLQFPCSIHTFAVSPCNRFAIFMMRQLN